MKGIGCDIIEIERIAQTLERHGPSFLAKTLTAQEQAYCLKHRLPAPHVAGRFAAKEAVAKALGCGFGAQLAFLDVEITADSLGKPEVTLSPEANLRFNYPKLLVTISHAKKYATAFAVSF